MLTVISPNKYMFMQDGATVIGRLANILQSQVHVAIQAYENS